MCLIFHEERLLGLFFSSPSFTELGVSDLSRREAASSVLPQILSRGLVFQDVSRPG